MKNPLFDRQHILEYIKYGFIATAAYLGLLIFFLAHNKYENLYYVYIGDFAFIAIIGYYTSTLIKRPYEGKRSVSMLIAGHLTLVCGIVSSVLFTIVTVLLFFPGVFSTMPPEELLQHAPDAVQIKRPAGLIFMLVANTILVSGAGASLLIVLMSYVPKLNQTKDKPASLEKYVSDDED